jgi:predicted phosphodiesterase
MRVLAIGDIHTPVEHPAYLSFCKDMQAKWKCDKVVFIGDVVDHHCISFHPKETDAPGPKEEYFQILEHIKPWYKTFAKAMVMIGNHDARPERVAAGANLSQIYLKSYEDVWDTPAWEWKWETIIDDVYYTHGTNNGGIHPSFNLAAKMGMSCVIGHCHSASGIKWHASPRARWFGMDTGCGIDEDQYAFLYAKKQARRPILSCGVVIDGTPYHEIMPCGPKEKYYHKKFKPAIGRRS